MSLVPEIVEGDWKSVEYALRKLAQKIGPVSTPTFAGLTIGGGVVSPDIIANWNSAYTWGDHALAGYITSVGGGDHSTLDNLDFASAGHSGFQAEATNLTSLAGLTFASTSFVKMSAAGTFVLDTNTYYKSGDSPTFAGLTLTGFSGFLKATAGVISAETFGTASYIPYSSGTGFSYSANLAFDTTNGIICGLAGRFTNLGIGAAPAAASGINLSITSDQLTVKGIANITLNNRSGAPSVSNTIGVDFIAQYGPAANTTARTCTNLIGGNGYCLCFTNTAYNSTATNVIVYKALISALEIGAGLANIGTGYFFQANAATKAGGAIGTLYAFYDAGQTAATNNWGFYGLTANHFLAALQIGGTPATYLGMGAGTLGVTGLITATGGISLPAGANIALATTTGTKIGTATSQLLGFYNQTPVNQPDTVADPTGGLVTDAECRTAVGAVIDRLQELGLIA